MESGEKRITQVFRLFFSLPQNEQKKNIDEQKKTKQRRYFPLNERSNGCFPPDIPCGMVRFFSDLFAQMEKWKCERRHSQCPLLTLACSPRSNKVSPEV